MTGAELWGYIVGGLGMVSIIVTILRNNKSDSKTDGKSDGVILTELGYLKAGVDSIQRNQREQEEKYVETIARIVALEAAARQAHKRLDDHIESTRRQQGG